MIEYLIVDDEHMAHSIIKGYCDKMNNMQLAKQCFDALEALEYLRAHSVDLIFLDINMPKLKGFEFLKTLSNPPSVIVTTAYKEHALEGYELNIVDYLLKPFGFERFLKAINKVDIKEKEKVADLEGHQTTSDVFFLYTDKKHIQVRFDEILFIEAAGNYIKVNTEKETLVTRDKLSEFLKKVPASLFIQVHKSFVVSLKHINSIEGNRIQVSQHVIPIGKTYKENVINILN